MSTTPESQLLAQVIAAYVNSREIAVEVSETFSWQDFEAALDSRPRTWQPLGAVMYRSDFPWDLQVEGGAKARPMRAHSRLVIQYLAPIMQALNEAGVDAVVLKGPALALTVYDDPDQRFISDLDLLVARTDITRVQELAAAFGFFQPDLMRSERFYQEHHFHTVLKTTEDVHLEIHWDLTPPTDPVRFDLTGIRERAQPLEFEGVTFPVCDAADATLHLVSQMLPSLNSVGRLLDVCLLLQRSEIDPEQLASRAVQQGLATPTWIVLQLVHTVTGWEIPDALASRLQPSLPSRVCLECLPLRERLLGIRKEQTGVDRLLTLICAPSWKAALKAMWRVIVPGEREWLDAGYEAITAVPWRRRWGATLGGFGSLAKMGAYLAWRLTTRPWRCGWRQKALPS